MAKKKSAQERFFEDALEQQERGREVAKRIQRQFLIAGGCVFMVIVIVALAALITTLTHK